MWAKIMEKFPWKELDNFIYMIAAIVIIFAADFEKEMVFLVLGAIIAKLKASNGEVAKDQPLTGGQKK